MITVTIEKDQSNHIHSFEMKGHADFAEHGKDLVCAAATAVSFGAVNAIAELTKVIPDVKQGQDGGFLKVSFPQDLNSPSNEQVQLIVQAMIVSLQTIEQDYGQYIKITFKK
ncbi:ribosomal-processing cysteine protease Prp [Paenisporosarcina quisquiliarum]|uniref:Ribosomal processing cysteine protease Prp n=1 Tax=Paenisporosarcina quisquiliarum TaxID=365346 RepID=A0A9X3LE07_9BACL|nr:ribosomal-processing cysteine protease Prp [Paenisporosarcina quisquiliarum]MCZ8536158.1 ribosomal-processing cysteine protease Prp [Paenisporosarcina quisquiliarum]